MRILIISDAYPPEIRSSSHLMQELAEELKERGHYITVVTCQPRYNLVEAASSAHHEELTVEEGVRVIRVPALPHHKVNFLLRGISQLTLPIIFWRKARQYIKEGLDAVIVYSPPLPLWRVGLAAKRYFGARFILNIQDIFPQNAIDLEILGNPFLIRFFQRMEKSAYHHADVVTVHSTGNREFLLREKRVFSSKLVTLHNWVETVDNGFEMCETPFRIKLGLQDKFIFLFGGVMGPSQGLELLIEAASRLKGEKAVVFLLVGDGAEKEKLQRRARDYELENVLFHPFVSKREYHSLLREIDVGLVCLTSKNKTPVVPAKLLAYMASSIPVLAFLNRESDGHQIIQEAGCGYSALWSCPDTAADLMLRMYRERGLLKESGERGRDFATAHFSKNVCVDKVERLIRP